MLKKVGMAFAILLSASALAHAAASITVGDHVLLVPGDVGWTNKQPISIFVSGGGTNIQGTDLNAQIGDGGPLLGGSTVAPGFTGTKEEILTGPGTIFASNNTGVNDVNNGAFGNLVLWLSTTTASGFVNGTGLLATLYIDTTGWTKTATPQVWPLVLGAGDGEEFPFNSNGPTDLLSPQGDVLSPDLGGLIVNGHIIIPAVPEPASIVLGLFAVAGLGAVAVRNRRRSA